MSSNFCIRILPSELPLDATLLPVAAQLPCIHLGRERGLIQQTSIKALPVKNADFDFSHVEPTGMFGRVEKKDTSQQRIFLLNPEHVIETFAKVGIEIVPDQMDVFRFAINSPEQVLNECQEIGLGTTIDAHEATAC